jgi:hypothetical protein
VDEQNMIVSKNSLMLVTLIAKKAFQAHNEIKYGKMYGAPF